MPPSASLHSREFSARCECRELGAQAWGALGGPTCLVYSFHPKNLTSPKTQRTVWERPKQAAARHKGPSCSLFISYLPTPWVWASAPSLWRSHRHWRVWAECKALGSGFTAAAYWATLTYLIFAHFYIYKVLGHTGTSCFIAFRFIALHEHAFFKKIN